MAGRIARGDIWLLERPRPDRRRPILVLTRPSLIGVIHTVTVAAITSTLRGSPTEVVVGVEQGLKHTSCINLINLFTVPQSSLRHYVGNVGSTKMREVCRALVVACGCD